jgi:hypothetical protein
VCYRSGGDGTLSTMRIDTALALALLAAVFAPIDHPWSSAPLTDPQALPSRLPHPSRSRPHGVLGNHQVDRPMRGEQKAHDLEEGHSHASEEQGDGGGEAEERE